METWCRASHPATPKIRLPRAWRGWNLDLRGSQEHVAQLGAHERSVEEVINKALRVEEVLDIRRDGTCTSSYPVALGLGLITSTAQQFGCGSNSRANRNVQPVCTRP